jgi:hypothetical protein
MEDSNEYQSIVNIMAGIHFYQTFGFASILDFSFISLATYRSLPQVKTLFQANDSNAWELIDPDDILEAFKSSKGIYCVELHNNYKSLKALAEDLIIAKLAGLMYEEMGSSI